MDKNRRDLMLDLVEQKIINWGFPAFFITFCFLPEPIKFKLLYLSSLIFFSVFFFLCSYWAKEWYQDKYLLVGFLVSFLHTFLFFLVGVLALAFSTIFLKFLPLMKEFLLKVIFVFLNHGNLALSNFC